MSITRLVFALCLAAPLAGFANSESKRLETGNLLAASAGPGSCKYTKEGKSRCKITSKADCEKLAGSFVKEGTCKK